MSELLTRERIEEERGWLVPGTMAYAVAATALALMDENERLRAQLRECLSHLNSLMRRGSGLDSVTTDMEVEDS